MSEATVKQLKQVVFVEGRDEEVMRRCARGFLAGAARLVEVRGQREMEHCFQSVLEEKIQPQAVVFVCKGFSVDIWIADGLGLEILEIRCRKGGMAHADKAGE